MRLYSVKPALLECFNIKIALFEWTSLFLKRK